VATCLNNLAVVYKLQGLFSEAESLYRRALAILEDPIGAGPIRRRPPLWKNMASLYDSMGKPAQARELLLRAGQIRSKQ
jgi:tetratricopeptide (TPR) repeat protein